MMGYYCYTVTCLVLLSLHLSDAFKTNSWRQPTSSSSSLRMTSSSTSSTPEEARAAALTDYLARAHEEKLRAISTMEKQKNEQISALKEELQQLKSSSNAGNAIVLGSGPPAIDNDLLSLSKEELAGKIVQYQQYMAKYIVNAQEEKMNAVRAAEAAVSKKFEERLMLLQGSSDATSSSTSAPVTAASATVAASPLYEARNKAVTAAAKAGKSRWGDMEVQRVNVGASIVAKEPVNGAVQSPSSAGAAATATAATPVAVIEVPPEVIAADHGLRADGGVGGLTLAERVALGAKAAQNAAKSAPSVAASSSPVLSANEILYQRRNARVLEAAEAGKSRWAAEEIERVKKSTASLPSGAATARSANLPLTLEQRVNLGARLLGQ